MRYADCFATAEDRRRRREQRARVGRSQPNAEIAEHEERVQILRADLQDHEASKDDRVRFANWTTLTFKVGGYTLRWGQFRRDLANDWWWGDDDEANFAALKAEYNRLLGEVVEYTTVKPEAKPADVVSPDLKEDDKKPPGWEVALEKLTLVGAVFLAGYALVTVAPVLRPAAQAIADRLRRGRTPGAGA